MKTKSALSYAGSDADVAEEIASYFSPCNHVVCPFVGGASILKYLTGKRIVANDLNDLAINFYRVASGRFGKASFDHLLHECSHTLSHPSELARAKRILDQFPAGRVSRAWAYWAFCWIGRGGMGGTKGLLNQTKPSFRMSASGGSNATRLITAADDLGEWAECFQNCEWTCLDFEELIAKVHDTAKTGLYCDCPWHMQGDQYLHDFSEDDHRRLAESVKTFILARVLLRYDDCEFIRELYSGWHIKERSARSKSNSAVPEIWITNHEW